MTIVYNLKVQRTVIIVFALCFFWRFSIGPQYCGALHLGFSPSRMVSISIEVLRTLILEIGICLEFGAWNLEFQHPEP